MKYIIVDLDDTLLTVDKKITEYSLDIIKRVRELGYLFVFNSARSYKSCMPYMKLVRPDYTILNGGNLICDKDFNIIYQNLISKEVTNIFLEEIKRDPMVKCFSIQGDDLYSRDYDYIAKNRLCKYFSFNEEFPYPCYKILLSAENKTKWIEMASKYNLLFEQYLSGKWFRLSTEDKYRGNKILYRLLEDNDVMDYVFGDDRGDKDMIDNAYYGVYLLNSYPGIYSDSDHITKYDNNHDGVCRYLNELFLGGKE